MKVIERRTPQGVRGLKFVCLRRPFGLHLSHPARGAWIEIIHILAFAERYIKSHPARGAWIEISGVQYRCSHRCRRTPQGVRGLKFAVYLRYAVL